MLADPDDCVSYYKCVAGCAVHQMCERNFLFDDIRGYCNYPSDVSCPPRPCKDPSHCPPTTTPNTPTTTTPDCGHVIECKDLGGDGYHADPYNCRKYWHCYAGRSKHILCEGDLLYDEANVWCDYPDNVPCGDRPICDECDDNCEKTTTAPSPTPDCGHLLNCTGLADGWYADPYNCRKYWHCSHGQGEHHLCEDDLVYDVDHVWCDYPDRVECGERPVCDECDNNCQEASTTPKPCDHTMDCSDKLDGWYTDPYNCRKYWHCDHGVGEHFMCEGNLLYDPSNTWCDYPERVDCHGRPICDECDENCT